MLYSLMVQHHLQVNQKVRIHSEYLLLQQFFVQNNICHEKSLQWPTFPYSHTEGSGIYHSVL